MLHFRPEARMHAVHGANLPAARARLVATDIGEIDVFEAGDRRGRAIILVTHGLGSVESFEEIAEELAVRFPDRRIVTYSRPARGRSPALDSVDPADDLLAEAGMVLPALLRALSIRRADVVGHGDGAAIAMVFARAYPGMADRIVAISPQVHADRQFIQATRDLPADERGAEISLHLGAVHLDPGAAYRRWHAARKALCAVPDALLDRIDGLAAPTLLIQGLRDEYDAGGQISAVAARISGPVKWILLQQSGHYPQYDSPGVVLDLIESHLASPVPAKKPRLPVARDVAFA